MYLLAHLFDDDFQVYCRLRRFSVCRLGTKRIGFPIQFLHQEIQPPADRFPGRKSIADFFDMCLESIEFFTDIELLRDDGQFLFLL